MKIIIDVHILCVSPIFIKICFSMNIHRCLNILKIMNVQVIKLTNILSSFSNKLIMNRIIILIYF